MDKKDVDYVDKNLLGFNFTLREYLDHLAILSWLSLISHKCYVGRENVNFDGREFIQLPSGKKVKITIKIEEL